MPSQNDCPFGKEEDKKTGRRNFKIEEVSRYRERRETRRLRDVINGVRMGVGAWFLVVHSYHGKSGKRGKESKGQRTLVSRWGSSKRARYGAGESLTVEKSPEES